MIEAMTIQGIRDAFRLTAMGLLIVGCSDPNASPASREAVSSDRLSNEVGASVGVPVALPWPAMAPVGEWVSLFDGRSMDGWRVLDTKAFSDHAEVSVVDGAMILRRGRPQTGIGYEHPFPQENYEVEIEAKRIEGNDFFCGMTFPVGEEPCTLIIGGWGGTVVGLSNVDGFAAVENETTTGKNFEHDRWYDIRLRVTMERIEVWIDDEPVIDLAREGHTFAVWWEQEPARPFGVATWDTGSALRDIRVRRLAE